MKNFNFKKMEEFLNYQENIKMASRNTIRNYKIAIGQFEKYCNKNNIQNFNNSIILEYLGYMNNNLEYSYQTIKSKFYSLVSFSEYMYYILQDENQFKIDSKLIKHLGRKDKTQKDVLYISDKDFKKMKKNIKDIKDELILSLGCYCGLRIGEITTLKIDNIDLEGKSLKIDAVDSKSSKTRLVNVPDFMVQLLTDGIGNIKRKDNTLLGMKTISVNKRFRKLIERSGVNDEYTPHSMRHRFGTVLYKKGISVAYIKEQMGHGSIQTTMNYYVHDVSSENVNLDKIF